MAIIQNAAKARFRDRAIVERIDLLIANASEVVTSRGAQDGVRGDDLRRLEIVENGAVAVADGVIVAVGPTEETTQRYEAHTTYDASGRVVSAGLVDSHSHLVFSGSRHDEFEYRAIGRPKPDGIAGGIHRTVAWTNAERDEKLTAKALADLDTFATYGTTTLETKTGYGLSAAAELRLLKLTTALSHAVEIVPTFLPAHVPPPLQDRTVYIESMLDALGEAAPLAEYCDVTCDPIGFTPEECRRLGRRARELGLGLRVHADQTGDGGGALLAAELGAASADHLDYTTDTAFAAMAQAGTAAILLPGVTYHMIEMTPRLADGELGEPEKPFMPLVARRAVASGALVALSTDYNPGTCPTPSMQAVMQLAARLFRLGTAEIWNMSTINAAASLGRGHDRGSLESGKRADIVIWDVPRHGMVIDRFGVNLVDTVFIGGKKVVENGIPNRSALRDGWPSVAQRLQARGAA